MAVVFLSGAALRLAFVLLYRPAFLGIPDTGSYLNAAHGPLFGNVYDPAGYPLFVRLLHGLYPHLSLLIVVQHGLGLATAALYYLCVRRTTGSAAWALIPAAVILFDGYALWVEHTPITETLFSFLVAVALYLTLRSTEAARLRTAGVGVVLAAAGLVRPIGFILVPVCAAWLLWTSGLRGRQRLIPAAALALPAIVLAGAYVLVQRSEIRFTGLTQDSGRVIYARAAQFADCARFTPPSGTRALCETIPPGRRGSFNQYLTGAPDHAALITAASRAISPAWRAFGPPPGGNGKLEAFALTAILHQPLDYVRLVVRDFHYYWSDHHHAFIAADARPDPGIQRVVSRYYAGGGGVSSEGLGFLRWWGNHIQVTGPGMIVLLLFPLPGLLLGRGPVRRGAALLAATGWLLPLVSDAVASVDPRFMLPAYGPLAAAGAIGLGRGTWRRIIPYRHRAQGATLDSPAGRPTEHEGARAHG